MRKTYKLLKERVPRTVAYGRFRFTKRQVRGGRRSLFLISCFATSTLVATTVMAADQSQLARGQAIARNLCSPCHAVGKSDPSPTRVNVETAFRDLHRRFPIEMLVKAEKTGEIEGHDEMPGFRLSGGSVTDLLAYIDSLSPPGAPRYTATKRKR